MRKQLIISLFVGVALIQIATPLSMIAKREGVLQTGGQFKFKVAPVDPYDAFRGRYVALRLLEDKAVVSPGIKLDYGQRVFAYIVVDELGFAKFSTLTTVRPQGAPYIDATVASFGQATSEVRLNLPIDRYYMEEEAAPKAERIYQRHASRGKEDAYVLVRIKDGFAVIEELYVGGRRIEEAIKNVKE